MKPKNKLMPMPSYIQLIQLSLLTSVLSLGLISCGGQSSSPVSGYDGPPSQQVDVSGIPDAVPQKTSRSKYGNPKSYVVFGKRYYVMSSGKDYKERGIASWYGSKFHGKRTSSGEPYDMHAMTAAHKTLPLPAYVKVTNLKNGRQVILKVNDRGPFHENRIIDLSHTAAVKLGIKGTGTGLVEVESISPGESIPAMASVPKAIPVAASAPAAVSDSASDKQSAVSLYLQLGAFVSSQNAYQLKDRLNLALSANQAYIVKTLKDAQQFYRVRIGPFNSIEQADSLVHTLNQKGFANHRIVIE